MSVNTYLVMLLVLLSISLLFVLWKYRIVLAKLKATDFDELTGIYNRSGFNLVTKRVYASHTRDIETHVSITYLDIDDFKTINDGKGHGFGDDVLKIFAKVLMTSVRATDIVGRRGGDEFMIMFINPNNTKSIKIDELLARMRTEFEKKVDELYSIHHNEARPPSVSFSFGIAKHQINRDSNLENLITKADEALYKNKKLRGRI